MDRRRGLCLLLLLLWAALAIPAAAQSSEVLVARVDGPVTPTMASFFERVIRAAEADEAAAVIVVLDTPGGGLDPTQAIVQIFRTARVPVVVYVAPAGAQAASAGSVITAAAHAAGMAPETVIGAASPVDGSGADIEETLYRKLTEDMKATMRNLTRRRGEEAVALAEAMIDEARAVTADEALAAGFIDAVASDLPDLLRQLEGLEVVVGEQPVTLRLADAGQREVAMNAIEAVLHALSNPLLIGILLTIGVQAILIEISSPGGWAAGFIGVVSLGLALYGLGTLPANWFGLGLIAVAFVLFLLEVKAATHGALATAGAITLLAGLLVLFNSPGTPAFARISLPGAATISLLTAAFFVFAVTKALQAQQGWPITGAEGLIGRTGPVKRKFIPSDADAGVYTGTILVQGELWQARANESLAAGEKVVVEDMDGFTLRVRKAGEV